LDGCKKKPNLANSSTKYANNYVNNPSNTSLFIQHYKMPNTHYLNQNLMIMKSMIEDFT